jgi:hypothetical protein
VPVNSWTIVVLANCKRVTGYRFRRRPENLRTGSRTVRTTCSGCRRIAVRPTFGIYEMDNRRDEREQIPGTQSVATVPDVADVTREPQSRAWDP